MVSEDETRSPMEACQESLQSPRWLRCASLRSKTTNELTRNPAQPLGKKKVEKKKNDLHHIWENGFLIQSINN